MIKRFIKSLLPRRVILWRYEQVAKRRRAEFESLSTEEVFTKIYTDRV